MTTPKSTFIENMIEAALAPTVKCAEANGGLPCEPESRRREVTLFHRYCMSLAIALSLSPLAVAQVREDPQPVRLPIVTGYGIPFTHISTANGLSQTRVPLLVQDERGFIWRGTQYGLNRYDGYEFKVFLPDARRVNSLGGVYISALFKDRSGRIWIGCAQSLDRFDPITETFTHYRIDPNSSDGIAGTVVNISQDSSGRL